MLAAVMPVWAHVALFAALFAACAWAARGFLHDMARLRKSLGSCRAAFQAEEIARKQHQKDAASMRLALMSAEHELKRYRQQRPMDMRETQLHLAEDEPDPAA